MKEGRLAILYFAYRPEKEAIRKPLLPEFGHDVNVHIYKMLQSRVSDIMQPTGLPVFHVDDTMQKGNGFGERLCNAAESIFKKGFDRLIILGNDAYGLKPKHLNKAIEQVRAGNSCLLPSELGGALMIGMEKSQYNRAHWLELPWCTEKLFNELFDCLSSCKLIDKALPELNSNVDIHELLIMKGELTELAAYLLAVLETSFNENHAYPPFHEDPLAENLRFRGPPFMA